MVTTLLCAVCGLTVPVLVALVAVVSYLSDPDD